ncbi:MAG: histidinol-phosphatase HisJ family protein [Clostridiales bacterium]|nr:histidinol-phosphatase HisJ family protein [Clostridiales bacterium]
MIYTDLHVHSRYCDGKNAPEDLVLSAIERGLKRLGILAHSYIDGEDDFVLLPSKTKDFIDEINNLKIKYKDNITIYCGIEQDYFSKNIDGFDYKIGSVHFVSKDDKLYPLDVTEASFVETVKTCFNGDYLLAVEKYFELVSNVLAVTNADVIGHLDIITKYNRDGKYFDVNNQRYVTAYKKAVDKLIPYGKPFEINTGGIARGYKNEPYPSIEIIDYIKSKGGKFVLSSDSHDKKNLGFMFEDYKKYI